MCIATAGLLAMGMGAAGTGMSAMGSIEQGYANANAANYNAQVARLNASYASASGSEQATITSLKSAERLGSIKASQAANNVDVNTGSALQVQQSAREAGVLDTATVENNALLTAYGYKNEAALYSEEAQQDVTAGWLGAGGDLLSGGSSLGFKWAGMQNPNANSAPIGGSGGGSGNTYEFFNGGG